MFATSLTISVPVESKTSLSIFAIFHLNPFPVGTSKLILLPVVVNQTSEFVPPFVPPLEKLDAT